jgi:hypothetical protein
MNVNAHSLSGLRFADMPSACPDETVSAASRFDPYWDGLWQSGSQASWVSKTTADRQSDSGLAAVPRFLDTDVDIAWDRMWSPSRLPLRLRVLGALDMWRTASAEQLAAITGIPSIASGRSLVMAELFTLGLVDAGVFTSLLRATATTRRSTAYRPSATEVFRSRLTQQLTYPEWVAVTGGLPFSSTGQYDRHNLLGTELALRVAEWCEIGTTLGEKHSTVDLLTGSGLTRASIGGTTRAADATFVRTDGARIAIEVTASTGDRFTAKVRKWAADLSRLRMADSGLVVMFVVAERPDRQVNHGDVRTKVLQTVAEAARDHPGVSFDRTAERILVADWRDWFPTPGHVSPLFRTLDARRPTGPAGVLWERVGALDVFDVPFSPTNPALATAILDNANSLGGVPHWLRDSDGPPLWQIPMRRAWFDRTPTPKPARPESNVGMAPGAAKGVAGAALPPRRLRAPLGGA